MKNEIIFNSHLISQNEITKEALLSSLGIILSGDKEDDFVYVNIKSMYFAVYGYGKISQRNLTILKQGMQDLQKAGIIERIENITQDCYLLYGVNLYRKQKNNDFWIPLTRNEIQRITSSGLKSYKNLLQFYILFLTRRDYRYAKIEKYKYKFINESISYISCFTKTTEEQTTDYIKKLEDIGVLYVIRRPTTPSEKRYYRTGNIYCAYRYKNLLLEFMKVLNPSLSDNDLKEIDKILNKDVEEKKKNMSMWTKYGWVLKGKVYPENIMQAIYKTVLLYNMDEEERCVLAKESGEVYYPNYKTLEPFKEYNFGYPTGEKYSIEWLNWFDVSSLLDEE